MISKVQSRAQLLGQATVFQGLSEIELKMVVNLCQTVHFLPGETVCAAGSRRQRAFVIVEGTVGVMVDSDGWSVGVDTFHPGELVASSSLLGTAPVGLVTYQALTQVRALAISGARFQDFAREYPQTGLKIMTAVVGSLRHRTLYLYYSLAARAVGGDSPLPSPAGIDPEIGEPRRRLTLLSS